VSEAPRRRTARRDRQGRRVSIDLILPFLLCVAAGAAGSARALSPPPEPRVVDRPLDAGYALRANLARSPDDSLGHGAVERYELLRRGPNDSMFVVVAGFSASAAEESFDFEDAGLRPGTGYLYKARAIGRDGSIAESGVFGPVGPERQWFFTNKANTLVAVILFVALVLAYIRAARRGKALFVRRISGLDAIDEAVGRSTEMGRSTLYIPGMGTIADVATIASLNILGQVARRIASYQSRILVPNRDPIVFPITQDVVRLAFTEAGYTHNYRTEDVYFVTNDQFSYAAAVCGTMAREKPAASFLMGTFYAEALVLAETGSSIGAIQIAGTDAISQLPFFVTACDYTIIGEELYAASAYLSREPSLLGSLKGQDVFKLICIALIAVGALTATAGVLFRGEPFLWIAEILRVRGTGG
jgi:hypothetical protein